MTVNPKFLDAEVMPHVGQLLLDAANVIRRDGHCKYVLTDKHGRVCLLGAIYAAVTGQPYYPTIRFVVDEPQKLNSLQTAWNAVARATGDAYPLWLGHDLAEWNNAPERTAEEVISVLETAAFYPTPTPAFPR